MFAKVENGVTKIVPLKTQFRAEIFHIFQQDRLLFAKVDIGLTQFPTKTAKKEEEEKGPEIFFKSRRAHPVINGEFSFFSFWPRKN